MSKELRFTYPQCATVDGSVHLLMHDDAGTHYHLDLPDANSVDRLIDKLQETEAEAMKLRASFIGSRVKITHNNPLAVCKKGLAIVIGKSADSLVVVMEEGGPNAIAVDKAYCVPHEDQTSALATAIRKMIEGGIDPQTVYA